MQLRDGMALWMGVLADSLDDIVNVQRLGQMLVHAGGNALVDVLHKGVVIILGKGHAQIQRHHGFIQITVQRRVLLGKGAQGGGMACHGNAALPEWQSIHNLTL